MGLIFYGFRLAETGRYGKPRNSGPVQVNLVFVLVGSAPKPSGAFF